MFPKNVALAYVVEQKQCGSDIEDGPGNDAPISLVPDWQSDHLNSVLQCLDKMVITQAQHHKTVSTNERLYTQSKRNFKRTKGPLGVPRGLPLDCYSTTYWKTLSQYKQQTISKAPACGLDIISHKLKDLGMRNGGSASHPPPATAPPAQHSVPVASGSMTAGGNTGVGGSMNVD
ncbi:hypothetical protein PTTG_07235 [Puccinia triticina 1-1 BBBD Race 1]|uniref:Uncharacterized protein n=1 Tax=Puccinia triticina (isolate 1-1 / race 1 (BBBD)) TaxID=630390 RepID=A0A0C4F2B4_PUCT1|nr:hypothetical protein PTTG_07235 [Puccinia triticina 1-1 BBBD Race 1]